MTPKIKERLLNLGITVLTSFGAVFLSFALFAKDASKIRINNELQKKADTEYVDMRDNAIIERIENDQDTHQIQHSVEYMAVQDQLELIIKLIKNEKD